MRPTRSNSGETTCRSAFRLCAVGLLIALLAPVSSAAAAPAKKIGELKTEGLSISIAADSAERFDVEITNKGAPIETPEVFTLENPPRLVIDIPKVEVRGSKKAEVKSDKITGIRLGVHPGKARIVIDLASAGVPGFVVSGNPAAKSLAVKLNFNGSAVAPEGAPEKIDLSDLPKPDAEPDVELAKQPTTVEIEPKKELQQKAPTLREPKEPVKKEPAKKEPVKKEPEHLAEQMADGQAGLSPDEKELDRSLKEMAAKNTKLSPAPEDLDKDFQDIPPIEPEREIIKPTKSAVKEPVKEAIKEPVKEAVNEPAKRIDEISPDEMTDEDALKMLELAGESAKKPPAPEKSVEKTLIKDGEPKVDAHPEKTLADLAAEKVKKPVEPAAGPDEDGSPEQLAKLLNESEKTEGPKTGSSTAGSLNPPPAGAAVVKGIFYRAADEGKTSAVVIEVGSLNNYSLSQKKKNLYELTIDQAGLAGEHVAYPQFPPDTFQGFEAVLAEQQGTTVVVKLYVAEGTKLSPFRVKDQLWVKVLK